MTSEILNGNIVCKGFFDNLTLRNAWLNCSWIGAKQGMIDPLRETQASALKIQNHLSTKEQEYCGEGNWYDAMRDYQKEVQTIDELGIAPIIPGAPQFTNNTDTKENTDANNTDTKENIVYMEDLKEINSET
jgi:capsid protein